LHYLNVNN